MDTTVRTRTTFTEYSALPETNQIVELIDGEIVMNPPLFRHQKTLLAIIGSLLPFQEVGQLCIAPSGLHLDEANSFEPDLFWVRHDSPTCFLEANGRYWHGAPDLVVEVLSPSTAYEDRSVKFDRYQAIGVREYWIVDPEALFVEVYTHNGAHFERGGVFKAGQSFACAALNNAPIDLSGWFTG